MNENERGNLEPKKNEHERCSNEPIKNENVLKPKTLYQTYANVDPKRLDLVHHSVTPKFKKGDIVIINTGESPKIVIENHILQNLWGVMGVNTFNGRYRGVYYTSVKTTDKNGTSKTAIEPVEIELYQDMYKLAL